MAWPEVRLSGAVQELHHSSAEVLSRGMAQGRVVRALQPLDSAVVLGSSQPDDAVDRAACAAAGVSVARRRTGGGAVLVEAGSLVWVDVAVPAGDPLWTADVGQAAWWLGDTWCAALTTVGLPGTKVWKGPMQRRAWSSLVCFAGLASGEVTTASGTKVVGISQRRARWGVLFQCACLLRWEPDRLLSLLALTPGERSSASRELAHAASGAGPGRAACLLESFLGALP
ncbi:MAG: lipoyl protein ligase domain-containing protein [Acidimicrobiales bacterium]